MMRHSDGGKYQFNQFTILGGFLFAVLFMLAFGFIYAAYISPDDSLSVVTGTESQATSGQEVLEGPAPSSEEYQSGVRTAMGPFLAASAQVTTAADFEQPPSGLADLVKKAEDDLFKMRVPKEYLESHMSLFLLLEQWQRALAGDAGDRELVLGKTAEITAQLPWLKH